MAAVQEDLTKVLVDFVRATAPLRDGGGSVEITNAKKIVNRNLRTSKFLRKLETVVTGGSSDIGPLREALDKTFEALLVGLEPCAFDDIKIGKEPIIMRSGPYKGLVGRIAGKALGEARSARPDMHRVHEIFESLLEDLKALNIHAPNYPAAAAYPYEQVRHVIGGCFMLEAFDITGSKSLRGFTPLIDVSIDSCVALAEYMDQKFRGHNQFNKPNEISIPTKELEDFLTLPVLPGVQILRQVVNCYERLVFLSLNLDKRKKAGAGFYIPPLNKTSKLPNEIIPKQSVTGNVQSQLDRLERIWRKLQSIEPFYIDLGN